VSVSSEERAGVRVATGHHSTKLLEDLHHDEIDARVQALVSELTKAEGESPETVDAPET
jgi:hypothetical protein